MTIQNKIDKILKDYEYIEYYKKSGEFWLQGKIGKIKSIYNVFDYCTNAKTKKEFLEFLENQGKDYVLEYITK